MSANQPIDLRVRLAFSRWPDDAPRGAVSTFCAEHGNLAQVLHELRRRAPAELARIFRQAGVARLGPKKKPRSAWRRFVYPAEYVLTAGRKCGIQLIDDHSRYAVASQGQELGYRSDCVSVQRVPAQVSPVIWPAGIDVCEELGPAFLPRSPLGGLLARLSDASSSS